MTVLATEIIDINRTESNFDKACEDAIRRAARVFGIDDCGHSTKVSGWERSCCSVRIVFELYECNIGMGCDHSYRFRAEAVKHEEDDD